MDFIFGTLATDKLKLIHHRARRTGVQHGQDISPRDPKPGEAITINVRTGPDVEAHHVACYYTTDNSIPAGSRGIAQNGTVLMLTYENSTWDTLVWGYTAHWSGQLPAQQNGTMLRYVISAWADSGEEIYADYPDVKITAEYAAWLFFRGEPLPHDPAMGSASKGKIFAVHIDHFTAPDWIRDAVIYQIFVDRFSPGARKDWLQTEDLQGFCGGTLWGIAEKLEYIADLGINCLWLSPTFASPTHHGYDITDYYQTEARLGGDAALHAVIDAAHARGIRVILDLVCNHTSDQHPYFQDALKNPDSPYRHYYRFGEDDEFGYRTFFGVASMPALNLAYPPARDWMLDAARYWLREFKVDGYRLDHADGPGPDFWTDFRAACKEVNPDCFLFGEIVDSPEVLQTFVGRLDGCLDFNMEDALRKTYGWRKWSETDFKRFAARHSAHFPHDFIMPTFLDNHDMDRFLFIVNGNKEALRRAAAAQFQLPGPPIIYYGTEVGMSQRHGIGDGGGLHVSRLPMIWDDKQDTDLLNFYKELIRGRKAVPTP